MRARKRDEGEESDRCRRKREGGDGVEGCTCKSNHGETAERRCGQNTANTVNSSFFSYQAGTVILSTVRTVERQYPTSRQSLTVRDNIFLLN